MTDGEQNGAASATLTDVARAAALKRSRRRALVMAILLALFLGGSYVVCIHMPGQSHRGLLPALSEDEAALAEELRRDVTTLAGEIRERNVYEIENYHAAADFIATAIEAAGCQVEKLSFEVLRRPCYNVVGEVKGADRANEIIVVAAHYDSVVGTVGANDNGSGVAGVLALARRLGRKPMKRTVRFVAFANEEPPFFQTGEMGSLVYAKQCRARGDDVVAMISLETIGYYSDAKDSQQYPFPLSLVYPSTGDFIGFVGNVRSRRLVRRVVGSFRKHTQFPSEGAAMPGYIPGVSWSDHWAFWQAGYPAIMVTDTAPFRYPYYHSPADTPDKLDYERLARVVAGLARVVEELANGG